ncbi:MAG: ParB/RepB/Spo0J family partition protein [Pseudomonadota bacterium]
MGKKSGSRGLGRGLSALLGEEVKVSTTSDNVTALQPKRGEMGLKELPLDLMLPNPDQPRTYFNTDLIAELAQSIKDRGVLQPILVRPLKNDPGLYEIIAGERRWRAAQKAQLHKVPVIIQDLSDKATFEIALIENVQRSDLNPMDEARAYHKLSDDFSHNAETIGSLVGKSRSHVANLMRLTALPSDVASFVENGELSMGHARALLAAKNPAAIAKKILDERLSVRQTEALIATEQRGATAAKKPAKREDTETKTLAADISEALGLRVKIAHKAKNGGNVTIQYKTLDQLDEVCRRLANSRGMADPF